MFNRGYLANSSLQEKVAIIGCGESARVFAEWSEVEHFDVFTTLGGGQFRNKDVLAVETLREPNDYQQIIIANQYVDEILQQWVNDNKSLQNVFWFDFMNLKLAQVDSLSYTQSAKDSSLHVIYDLHVLPATFDIAAFLVRAELRRIELGLDNINLIIIGGNFGGVSARACLNHGSEQGAWRIQNVLIPMSQMLKSCRGVSFIPNKKCLSDLTQGEATFPHDLSARPDFRFYALAPLQKCFESGADIQVLESPMQAKEYARQFLKSHGISKQFITISLREYTHQASRNSCIESYQYLAERVINLGLDIVLIRDTNKALEQKLNWEGTIECPVASFNVAIRMALYESAFMNISVSSGPSFGLMLLSRHCDFLMTHLVDNSQVVSSEAFLKERQGISVGEQFPFCGRFQRVCWTEDTQEIANEFELMIKEKLSIN